MQDQGAPGGNSPSGAQTPNLVAGSTLGWPSAPSSSVSWGLHLPSSTPPRVMCLTERHTNLTRRISNETKRDVNHRVPALDPLADASHYGRHRPWDIEGRALKHCVGRSRGVAVRDAGARRTAIGVRHHAARRVVRGRHARHPHEGGTLRRDRQVHRRLLLRLDTLGARRARGLHLHPLGARTVESATEPATVVQQPEHGKARFGGSLPPAAGWRATLKYSQGKDL